MEIGQLTAGTAKRHAARFGVGRKKTSTRWTSDLGVIDQTMNSMSQSRAEDRSSLHFLQPHQNTETSQNPPPSPRQHKVAGTYQKQTPHKSGNRDGRCQPPCVDGGLAGRTGELGYNSRMVNIGRERFRVRSLGNGEERRRCKKALNRSGKRTASIDTPSLESDVGKGLPRSTEGAKPLFQCG